MVGPAELIADPAAGRRVAVSEGAPGEGRITDEVLARRAADGDAEAVDILVQRHHERVLTLARRICDPDTEMAREMVQEAFYRAFRRIDSFRGESAFATWLHRITVNVCLDERRRRKRRERLIQPWRWLTGRDRDSEGEADDPPDPGTVPDPLSALRGRELGRAIGAAMSRLPDQQRLVFSMKIIDGMRISEIAEATGLAEGTVKSHLFRATRSMREELKDWTDT